MQTDLLFRIQAMKYNALYILIILAFLNSCKKTAGERGRASIKGKLSTQDSNNSFTYLDVEYPSADEDVYIIYGDDVSYGDRTRANYNGEFEFKYLRKGSYKIYVYSKDSTLKSPSGDIAIVKEVKIGKNKEEINLEPIVIFK